MQELTVLLERAAGGDQRAYRELYRRYRPLVVRLLGAFASLDRDEVEDVVQESFTRAFKSLPRLREAAAFESWLFSIARNRALTSLSRRGTAERVKSELVNELPGTVDQRPEALQLEVDAELVRRFIAELPAGPERETVELFYVDGQLSAREIAQKLGVGKSAITMRLERFRARIKRELVRRLLAARWE